MTARVPPPGSVGVGWTRRRSVAVLVSVTCLPVIVLLGPAAVLVTVGVAGIAWLSTRPARGLAIFTWLLPFHVLVMAGLYGGLGVSATAVRTLAAWKEAVLVACVLAAIVAVLQGSSAAVRQLTINWIDVAVAALLLMAACHLVAAGPWFGSDLTFVGRAYAFRDIAFFLLLYFVGRTSGFDVGDNPATLSRLFAIGSITALFGIAEYIFVPPQLLAAIGTSRYFSDFLNAGAFTAHNVWGLPDNYAVYIGRYLVRRAGSTYLVSTGFAAAQVVCIAAASVLVFRQDRPAGIGRWLGYAIVWAGLLLTITRMSIVAAVVEVLIVALWYRRNGIALGLILASGVAAISAVIVLPELGTFIWDTLTFQTASSFTHLTDWTHAVTVIFTYPLGAGLGTADETAVRFGTQSPLTADNLYFKYAVEIGIPAFLTHIAILVGVAQAARTAARRGITPARQRLGVMLLALTIGIMLNGLTTVLYNSNFLAYVYFWLAGSIVTIARDPATAVARRA